MIAQELEENIQFAFRDARERQLELVTVEHLLLALLSSREVSTLLNDLNANRRALGDDLEHFLKRVPRTGTGRDNPRPTPGFSRVLRHAMTHAKDKPVTGVNVICSVYAEPDSFGARFLNRHGVTKPKVNAWLRRNQIAKTETKTDTSEETGEELTFNLTAAAAAKRLEQPFCRDTIVNALLRVMCRKYKSNPVLVGEPGVGKTALVHTVAHLLAAGKAPAALKNLSLHAVDVASLVAGTKYRGDFEARLKKLLHFVASHPGTVLFIDEIHNLIGAGSVSGGSLDAANILKPALADGSLRCIGATTHTEYARVFVRDGALARRFQKIEVAEPTHTETVSILAGFKPRLEKHHGVHFAPTAMDAAVHLADRYLTNRCLPDKAIDLLDEAGAEISLTNQSRKIGPAALERTVARLSGLPAKAIKRDDRVALRNLERTLGRQIFGQPQALSALAAAVCSNRLGFADPERPVGAFLFAGPTGVGKTETARALAETLAVKLLRFDMSEHMEAHSVSRLIGAPPGYVGFEQHGQLTEQVNRHPHCVLLLDEIEKAHPDVFNILLQIMDYGKLTDNSSNQSDFRHAIIIMTTNAGADAWERPPLGFAAQDNSDEETASINRLFSPEFRNRLSEVIRFTPLEHDVARKIIARELDKLAGRMLAERGIKLFVKAGMRAHLLAEGFSPANGGRALQRIINKHLISTIVSAETRRKIPVGASIEIDYHPQRGTTLKQPADKAPAASEQLCA